MKSQRKGNTMIHWFTNDHFNPTSSAKYWRGETGADKTPPVWALDVVETVPESWAKDCNAWGEGDCVAGMKIADGRAAVFRIFDGGTASDDRGNRWVMLLAEGASGNFAGTDLLAAVESATFREFARNAKKSEIAPPVSPEAWRRDSPSLEKIRPGRETISGPGAEKRVRELSRAFSSDDEARGVLWVKRRVGEIEARADFSRREIAPKPGASCARAGTPPCGPESRARERSSGIPPKIVVLTALTAFLCGVLLAGVFWMKCADSLETKRAEIRDLKTELATLREENSRLRELCKTLREDKGEWMGKLDERMDAVRPIFEEIRKQFDDLKELVRRKVYEACDSCFSGPKLAKSDYEVERNGRFRIRDQGKWREIRVVYVSEGRTFILTSLDGEPFPLPAAVRIKEVRALRTEE